MIFRLMTHDEIILWYDTELTRTFVPQECKPLIDIFRLIEENRYEIWGLFEESTLLGYACLWKSPDMELVLLDYLGVTAARRSEGLGQINFKRGIQYEFDFLLSRHCLCLYGHADPYRKRGCADDRVCKRF